MDRFRVGSLPLVGRAGEGVAQSCGERDVVLTPMMLHFATPHPNPPPQGGRGPDGWPRLQPYFCGDQIEAYR